MVEYSDTIPLPCSSGQLSQPGRCDKVFDLVAFQHQHVSMVLLDGVDIACVHPCVVVAPVELLIGPAAEH